jgi:hypothetical protein
VRYFRGGLQRDPVGTVRAVGTVPRLASARQTGIFA